MKINNRQRIIEWIRKQRKKRDWHIKQISNDDEGVYEVVKPKPTRLFADMYNPR